MGAEGHDDAGSSHVEHVEYVEDGLSTIGSSDNHAFLEAGCTLKRNKSHDKMEGGCMLRRNMSRQNMEEMQEVMQEQLLIKSSATEATNVLEQLVSDSLQGMISVLFVDSELTLGLVFVLMKREFQVRRRLRKRRWPRAARPPRKLTSSPIF